MKLFISWSGEFSQKVAEQLSLWIPTIIQSVGVFYSPDDIAKGENWGKRLSKELDECSFGIICLTPENVSAPWIHFEAGALSKTLNSRVSAIMLNVSPSDIKGPLAYYQNTTFEREDFFRLFQSINESSDTSLKPEILRNSFDNAWENFKADIGRVVKLYTSQAKNVPPKDPGPNDSEAIQEILRLVRKLDGSQANANTPPAQPIPATQPTSTAPSPSDLVYARVRVDEQTNISNVLNVIRQCNPELTEEDISRICHNLRARRTSGVKVRYSDIFAFMGGLAKIGASATVEGE